MFEMSQASVTPRKEHILRCDRQRSSVKNLPLKGLHGIIFLTILLKLFCLPHFTQMNAYLKVVMLDSRLS